MKILKRLTVVLLAIMMFFCSCTNPQSSNPNDNSSSGGENQGGTEIENVQKPDEEHLQNNLHKITITEVNRPFVVNGQSDYKVLVPNKASTEILTAANYFVKYVKMATGYELPIESALSYSWDAKEKWIVIGRDDLFKKAGLSMPSEDLGISGYYIKSAGESVFVAVEDEHAYNRAILSLLDHVVGYEMYWHDTVVFEKDGKTLPNIEVIEKPDIAFYQESNTLYGDGKYGMGFDNNIWIPVEGKNYHNSFAYLPKVTFQKDHPLWYSTNDQGSTQDGTQLCYNAHGNEEERQLMIQECARVALVNIERYPALSTITLTQEDTRSWCGCDTCMKMKEDYNGSNAAAAVKFLNEVDNIVQAELQRQADLNGTQKRKMNMVLFAYRQSEQPPVKQNADGSYSPVDESVRCNDTVGVYIAPIETSYQESFYSNENAYSRENIRGWSSICKNLYLWTYDTNFHHYFFPLNSWDSKIETYRFLYENNTYYSYSQAQWDTGAVSHFSRFKDYIDQKASFNVNVSYDELLQGFFTHYYGPAKEIMLEYFAAVQSYMEYLTATYPAVVWGNYKENVGQSYLWPKGVLNSFMNYVNKAYESIEYLKESDPNAYELYYEHILLESMFPRFGLLYLYQSTYKADVFKKEAAQFKKDCYSLGMTKYKEGSSIDEIWQQWNV